MTTVPSGPISMSDISSAFGLANNLAAYYGVRWFKENNSRGYIQAAGNAISFSDFSGTRNTSPVVASPAGGVIYNSSQNITMPMFNSLTITVKGGDGGTHGVGGNCNGGGDGGAGYDTTLTGYVTAAGGSINGGTGSTATTSRSISDANQASILALYGTQPYGQVGAGGGGGATGYNTRAQYNCTKYDWVGTAWGNVYSCVQGYYSYHCDSATGGGSGGAPGYIRLDWS